MSGWIERPEFAAARLLHMRTVVDLTESQLAGLREYCDRHGISRDEAVGRAVQLLLDDDARSRREARTAALAASFGTWDKSVDPDKYLADLRAEWER